MKIFLSSVLMLGLFVIPAFSLSGISSPTAQPIPENISALKKYIQFTASGRWQSGIFGMVRNSGTRFHEGWDIKSFKKGESGLVLDEVFSVFDGRIVHICNENNGSYGKYIVLEHKSSNILFYTLYAHLNEIDSCLKQGMFLRSGNLLGVMGSTSSVYRIKPGFEHLHFEVGLRLASESFQNWYDKTFDKNDKNLHSFWNGLNLAGIDPFLFFNFFKNRSDFFELLKEIPTACSVVICSDKVPEIVKMSPGLLSLPLKDNLRAWEISFTWSGVPKMFTPLYAGKDSDGEKVFIKYVSKKYIHRMLQRGMIQRKEKYFEIGKHLRNTLEIIFGESF